MYLDHCASLSGAEIALTRILPVLRDVDAHVILGEDGPLVSRLLNAGISVEVLSMPKRARKVHRDELSVRTFPILGALDASLYTIRVAVRLRKLRPDLVHTNSLKAGIYGSVACRLSGIPVIWHVSDRIAEDYIPARAASTVRRLIRALPSAVIANPMQPSQRSTARRARQRFSGRRSGDIFDVARVRTRGAVRPLRIGIVGRLAPWKGQDVFLQAFARAFTNGSETAVVIGSALFEETDEYEQRLRTLVDELGDVGSSGVRRFR